MRNSSKRLLHPRFAIQGILLGFWLGVAVLHLFLFARRLAEGQWSGGLDQARLVLAVAGALYGAYGTLKIGSTAGAFGRGPRKCLAVILILVLGHLAIASSGSEQTPFARNAWIQVVLAAPLVAAAVALSRRAPVKRAAHGRARSTLLRDLVQRIVPPTQVVAFAYLYQLPPPRPR